MKTQAACYYNKTGHREHTLGYDYHMKNFSSQKILIDIHVPVAIIRGVDALVNHQISLCPQIDD